MAWTDAIYQYDGSFEGFLCCVYESYMNREIPIAFCGDEECFSLYPVRCVITVPEHARRVLRSLVKISEPAVRMMKRAFLTCMEERDARLYAFVRKLYAQGADFLRDQSDPVYHPLVQAVRHLNGELHKLRGFVRFSDYNGVLGGEIEPKNRVLPLLRSHFCNRFANESFFLYDRTHRELLLYAGGCSRILPVDRLELELPGQEEVRYRTLWKRFFETVAIRERTNPRCQNTFLPKRYRGTMTEFLPAEGVPTPAAAPAGAPGSGAPAGIPAPGILPGAAPSAPGSVP